MPWWGCLVMFVLAAGAGTANDFVHLTGTKALSAVIMVLLVVVFVTSVLTRSAPLAGTPRCAGPPDVRATGVLARPGELDCRMESARETCAYFRTSTEFLGVQGLG